LFVRWASPAAPPFEIQVANTADDAALVQRIIAGDTRSVARLISRVEEGNNDNVPVLRELYRRSGSAKIVGISGPPGAGKSTLVDQMIHCYRAKGLRVAVVAVDPSSPFSGGAVLGDRVRMAKHATDRDVFIRSLAARGTLGGVTGATADVLTVLDAAGWDIILLETVGVGQNEVEVMRQVPTVVVVQNPGDGDAVQSVKAGALEIAHVFAVNKADMAGADQVARHLGEMLATRAQAASSDEWKVPVVLTEASTGRGVADLVEAIDRHCESLKLHPGIARREALNRLSARVADLSSRAIRQQLSILTAAAGEMAGKLDDVIERRSDPYSLSQELLSLISQPD
jgi:LAO/AO transport system kinase